MFKFTACICMQGIVCTYTQLHIRIYWKKVDNILCDVAGVLNTKGWVWEGDVLAPTWSVKLKVIHGLKTNKTSNLDILIMGELSTCILCVYDGGCSQGGGGCPPPPMKHA